MCTAFVHFEWSSPLLVNEIAHLFVSDVKTTIKKFAEGEGQKCAICIFDQTRSIQGKVALICELKRWEKRLPVCNSRNIYERRERELGRAIKMGVRPGPSLFRRLMQNSHELCAWISSRVLVFYSLLIYK